MKKISIIVPVYNSEKYLKNCLDSILAQTLNEIELILIDDGSTDSSYEICREYEEKDDRIILISQENAGAASARNSGLAIAKGDYIGFVDSDDYIEADMYEKLYNFAKDQRPDIVMCQAVIHNPKGEKLYSYTPFRSGALLSKQEIKEQVIPLLISSKKESEVKKQLLIPMWCRIFKNDFILNNNISFENHNNGQDAVFTIEATCKAENMIIIDEYLYNYRNNIGVTLSKTYSDSRYDKAMKLRNTIIRVLMENNLYTETVQKRYEQLKRRSTFKFARLIVAEGNKQAFPTKIKELNKLLRKKETREAFENVDLLVLPLQQKVLYFMIKYKLTIFLFCAIKWKYKN